ncbi:MAG: hypothetical protein EXR98_21760 [Gemmataceae bacterium]|nr:hypothetical protein [Gemmataceae bacterium]
MLCQRGCHGEVKTGQRVARVRPHGIAAAESAVDFALGIQEKRRPGQVPVELEEVEIDPLDAQEADADELTGEIVDLLQTDNLPVKRVAIPSGVAAKHKHERLAGLLRQRFRGAQVGQPALLRRDLGRLALRQTHARGRHKNPKDAEKHLPIHSQTPSPQARACGARIR